MSQQVQPFVDSTSASDLREAMRQHGYLFIRNLAPKDQLLALRREMLAIIESAGWIKPTNDALDAIWSGAGPFTESESQYMAVYQQIINAPQFRAWADQPVFIDMMRKILGGEVLAHRLRIGRVTF